MTYRKQFSFPQVLILNTDGVFFVFFFARRLCYCALYGVGSTQDQIAGRASAPLCLTARKMISEKWWEVTALKDLFCYRQILSKVVFFTGRAVAC